MGEKDKEQDKKIAERVLKDEEHDRLIAENAAKNKEQDALIRELQNECAMLKRKIWKMSRRKRKK